MSVTWSAGELVHQSHSSERGSWGREEARNNFIGFIAKDIEQNSLKECDLGQYHCFAKV